MKSQAKIALNKATKKRVFVGLSGGVDSSVSAALLKKAGYDVVAVFIKVWQPEWLECTWREERRDAMRVAAHLGISFVTLDLEKEYKRDVVDYLLAEYKSGRTPNPDVMCNKTVKFGAFYDWVINNGADFVATGHYAQITQTKKGTNNIKLVNGDISHQLKISKDSNKDQTYFLWTLRQNQLDRILFPIGHLTKPQVRNLARKFKLPTAEKKDSQGICFIGMVDMKTFLSHYIESKEGNVLDDSGKTIGRHPGAVFFTIGERHGFTIDNKGPHDTAYYVISKNIDDNTIVVNNKEAKIISRSTIFDKKQVSITETNWIDETPILGKKYMARSRYRQTLDSITFASIDSVNRKAIVQFDKFQDTITPGQSLVIYRGNECIGGGVIV